MKHLYLVHDIDFNYKVVVLATDGNVAIDKVKDFLIRTNQCSEYFKKVNWIVSLCDNDKVLE